MAHLFGKKERIYDERKQNFKITLEKLLSNYARMFVVELDNVTSNQMHQVRIAMRGKAEMFVGKNTMVRFVIKKFGEEHKNQALFALADELEGNVALIFTNEDLRDVRPIILANRKEAPARVGSIAQRTVVVPAGPTGLEPTQTSFFQALQIPTKINKGAVEIMTDVTILTEGHKCGASQVALLNKLNVRPFSYGLVIRKLYDDGSVLAPSILDISKDDVKDILVSAIQNIAAVGLATGIPNKASFPHILADAFKNLLAVAVETSYDFPQAKQIKEVLKNPGAFAAAAAPAAAAPAAAGKAAAKAPEPEPEPEEEESAFSLFD
jgi:large subunit ribosomal protein LP0